jgi:hypothetical protein
MSLYRDTQSAEPLRGSGAARPHGALRAIDASARPRLVRSRRASWCHNSVVGVGYAIWSSLSVRGPPVNKGPAGGNGLLAPRCWPCVTGRGRGQGGAPAAPRGRTTLTPARTLQDRGSEAGTPGQRIGTTPRQAAGGGAAMARARGRPALSWSADPGSGDVMLDGVVPHAGAAARSFRAGQPGAGRQELCGSWPRLISGVGSARTGRIGQATCPRMQAADGGA